VHVVEVIDNDEQNVRTLLSVCIYAEERQQDCGDQ
jgi:hypothetical protein